MRDGLDSVMLRQFRTLFEAGTLAGLSDGQLLERFLGGRDDGGEVAFAALVARHGPMVLGVCRRSLRDPNDAADAFQATFLILVKKARSVRVDDSLGRWLYGVSRKVAGRARVVADRRSRSGEGGLDALEAATPDLDRFERKAILDEELGRLPRGFRSAIVLCDLEGLTHEEAARDLHCAVGTIKSRLARGRRKLRERLERRGLTPASLALAPIVPASLAEATARVARLSTVAGWKAAGAVPAASVVLAQEVLKAMIGFNLKVAMLAGLTLGVVTSGAVVLARGQDGGERRAVAETRSSLTPGEEKPDDSSSRIETKLAELVTIQLKDRPLFEAVKQLMTQTGANIVIDPRTIQEYDLTMESKVSLTAREIKLSRALTYLLRPLGLIYRVEDDVLLITSPPGPKGASNQQLLTDVSRELNRSRASLARALKAARDPGDPAVALLTKQIADFKAELIAIAQDPASDKEAVGPDQKAPGPKRIPSAVRPPNEFSKVAMPAYVVEPPDVLVVEVHQALPGRPITGERLVRPDGKISLGYYGDVYVAGLTAAEIKDKVALHLRKYLDDEKPDPVSGKLVGAGLDARVFVDVVSYNSKAYYVQGEVASPGRFPVTGNDTVLDAINYAGGLRGEAAKVNVRLIRPGPKVATNGDLTLVADDMTLVVDLAAIVDRGDAKTNYQLFPGDRLVAYRDPAVPPGPTPPTDVEARLQAVERKLDEVLKRLDQTTKP